MLDKFTNKPRVRDYLPLQQGLRLIEMISLLKSTTVRDYLPLQQGLRPKKSPGLSQARAHVRDYLPLQQGLRPVRPVNVPRVIGGQRLSSITTRIKT